MKPYSIMTLSFHRLLLTGELDLGKLLSDLAAIGIEGIEPATSLFTDRPDLETELPRIVADVGLEMPAYDALANLVDPDARKRQEAYDSVRRDVERCQAWKIPVVMVAGSRRHPDLSVVDCRKQVAEGMNRCLEFARPAGVTLALESFGIALDLHASSAHLGEVVGMCDDAIGTTFDMGNFVLGGDVPLETVETWLPRVVHVHVKDFKRLPMGSTAGLPSRDGHHYVGCRLDEGVVNVSAVIGKLREQGYTGALSLEMGGGDDLAEVAADLAIVKRAAEG